MSHWQVCPVCQGHGWLNYPPGVAFGQQTFLSSSAGPWPCQRCGATGTIVAPPNSNPEASDGDA